MLPHALHTRALLSAALCAAATASAHAGENQTARASNEPPPAAARVAKLTNIETSYPNWSPDGRRIVYQSNRSGNSEIYVMNADGTGVLRLTDHQAVDENPAWSPDGRRIAFRSYRDGNAEIYTMAPDGSGLRNLTNHPADDIHPYWSPDGSRIVFNSTRAPIDGKPVLTIFSMRSDGSDVRQISRDGFEETYAQLSPDASRIVLRRRLEEETPGWERNPGNSEIYVMNADGSNARRLTHHPGFDGWPSWSPDGAWIAYAAEGAGDFQVALIRPDGSGFTVLTNGPGSFTKPIFSPDGRSIICTRTLDGNVEIFLIELAAAPAAPPNSATPLALIERAAARMGGVAVLDQLPALTTGYHLLERSLGQEEWPRGAAASSVQVGKRLVQPHDPRERMQMRRHMSGGRVYDRAVDAGRWHRLVTGARLAATSVEHSLSAALASFHPESLLPALLKNRSLDASLQRPRVIDNRHVSVVLANFAGLPLTLFFDDGEGVLRGVEWNDPEITPAEDVPLRATFAQYRPAAGLPGTPRLPHLVEIWRGDELWMVRSYDEYAPASPGAFSSSGTGAPASVAVEQTELAAGTFHLRTADYAALLVEMPDRVVIVDLPDSTDRGNLILAHARERARGRPISIVLTHLHDDHLGGLLDTADLQIVADDRVLEDLRRMFASRNVRPPALTGVRGILRLGDGQHALEVRTVPHSHALGTLVAFQPAHGLLYEADLIRGLLPHSTFELVSWVESTGLQVRTVVSSHGAAQPWERVVSTANAWRAKQGQE